MRNSNEKGDCFKWWSKLKQKRRQYFKIAPEITEFGMQRFTNAVRDEEKKAWDTRRKSFVKRVI